MNKYQKKFRNSIAHCTLQNHEMPVKNGLSYTPADMREMTKKGYPVAPQSLDENLFSDSDNRPGNNFDVDVWERRSVSINDAWEQQQDSKKKIRQLHSDGLFEKEVKND